MVRIERLAFGLLQTEKCARFFSEQLFPGDTLNSDAIQRSFTEKRAKVRTTTTTTLALAFARFCSGLRTREIG